MNELIEKMKLKPSQTNANYGDLPEDINSYITESVMAKQPEVTLWDFIENKLDEPYVQWAEDIGSTLTETWEAKPFARLNLDTQQWIDWMMANQHTCQKKYYEKRPYHGSGASELTLNLPMKIGYNARNTIEYNWGLYGDSNQQIKDMMGDQDVWDNVIGIDKETALVRLLAYMPGQTLPWHHDNLGNWCRNNKHLNPDVDKQMCDLGPIRRHLLAVTDWHWGHVLQVENSYFPNWKAGELYNLPIPRPHCSTNMGMKLKVTCSISGAQINDNLSFPL
jgi:hypothetical protein